MPAPEPGQLTDRLICSIARLGREACLRTPSPLTTTSAAWVGRTDPEAQKEGLGPRRPKTWLEDRRREADELGYGMQPYVVIVGGGQGGIALRDMLEHTLTRTKPRDWRRVTEAWIAFETEAYWAGGIA